MKPAQREQTLSVVKGGQTPHFYEFAPFLIDNRKHVLLRDGAPVSLTPKAFETLLALIEAGGQVVEKDELMRRIWPDTVVEENNLAQCVSAVRKALGEDPREHRYVVTVPGRGYRFIASVRELDEEEAERDIQEPQAASGAAIHALSAALPISGIKRHKRGAAVALAAALMGIAAIVSVAPLIRQRFRTGQAPLQRNLSRLTYDTGLQSEPTW